MAPILKKIHILSQKSVTALLAVAIFIFATFPTLAHGQEASISQPSSNSQAQAALNGAESEVSEEAIAESIATGIGTCLVSGIFANGIKGAINWVQLQIENEADVTSVPIEDDDARAQRAKEVSSFQIGNFPVLGSWDQIGWCLVNIVIEYIGHSTVAWIKGGFNGNPVFVDDPEQFFRDIADIEAGKLIEELGGGFLCEPFRVNIQIGLVDEYNKRYGTGYGKLCTLSDIIENAEGFVEGNFEEGGWEGWFHMTQNNQNNPYGARYIFEKELDRRIAISQNKVNIDLTWGNGFLSFKDPETGETQTPGKVIDEQINNRLFNGERRLLIADEFDEIINALVNQLVKIALSEVLGD